MVYATEVLGLFYFGKTKKGALKMRQKEARRNKLGRVVAFLTREELDFIDKLAKDALFSTGRKLTRTDIIRAFVDAIKARFNNAEGVRSECELVKKIACIFKIDGGKNVAA